MKITNYMKSTVLIVTLLVGMPALAAPEKKYIHTLESFFMAWNKKDIDKIVNFFAEDGVYNNVPFPSPVKGKAEIRALLQQFIPLFGVVDLGAYNFIADGMRIAVERVDTFEVIPTHKTAVFAVCGVFYFNKDLKIERWNDYFDARTFEKQSDLPLPQ